MSAYIIVEVTVRDTSEYENYKLLTPAAVAAFDGKFIVRGGKSETLEGDWHPERIVVLEFPTAERAKDFWDSALYAKAKASGKRSAETKMIVVEGV